MLSTSQTYPNSHTSKSITRVLSFCILLLCEDTEIISNNQGNHGMWSNSDIVCPESSIKPQQSLLSSNLDGTINTTLIRKSSVRQFRLSLQSRLDKIKRQREK